MVTERLPAGRVPLSWVLKGGKDVDKQKSQGAGVSFPTLSEKTGYLSPEGTVLRAAQWVSVSAFQVPGFGSSYCPDAERESDLPKVKPQVTGTYDWHILGRVTSPLQVQLFYQ